MMSNTTPIKITKNKITIAGNIGKLDTAVFDIKEKNIDNIKDNIVTFINQLKSLFFFFLLFFIHRLSYKYILSFINY